jgi:hypothetical protein
VKCTTRGEARMHTADELREQARRARRLAQNLSDADRERLLAHAQELERQARELEERTDPSSVATSPAAQTQVQVQQQQQQQTGPPPDSQDQKPKR